MTSAAPGTGGRPVPPARPSLRDRKKEQNRREIQRQAIRLIEEQGYARTTVEQIAEAANVSSSTFFRYYRNKDEAVTADLVAEAFLQLPDTAPAEVSPVAALKQLVGRYYATMPGAVWEQEMRRTQLVLSVPELRGALLEELVRPLRYLTTFVARRLGRPADDPGVTIYAGAVFGGLIALFLPLAEEGTIPIPYSQHAAAALMHEIFDVLDATVALPGPGLRLPDRPGPVGPVGEGS